MPLQVYVTKKVESWWMGFTIRFKNPMNAELALIEQYANKGPEDVAETYGLTLPRLEGRPERILAPFLF